MFSSAKPAAPAPQLPPDPPPARTDAIVVQNEQREAARKKRGRASTILTSPQGDTVAPVLGAAQLLGRTG